jgi:hypothetical protein
MLFLYMLCLTVALALANFPLYYLTHYQIATFCLASVSDLPPIPTTLTLGTLTPLWSSCMRRQGLPRLPLFWKRPKVVCRIRQMSFSGTIWLCFTTCGWSLQLGVKAAMGLAHKAAFDRKKFMFHCLILQSILS